MKNYKIYATWYNADFSRNWLERSACETFEQAIKEAVLIQQKLNKIAKRRGLDERHFTPVFVRDMQSGDCYELQYDDGEHYALVPCGKRF